MDYVSLKIAFWMDEDIQNLTPEQRYFYLYLLTNPRVNQIGLYEFSKRHAALDTGYNTETIVKLLDHFEEIGKIKQSSINSEILICKFYHHNTTRSPKVLTFCNKLVSQVKDQSLLAYMHEWENFVKTEKVPLKVADTVSIPYCQNQRKEKKRKENTNKEKVGDGGGISDYLKMENLEYHDPDLDKIITMNNPWLKLLKLGLTEEILLEYVAKMIHPKIVHRIAIESRKGHTPQGLAISKLKAEVMSMSTQGEKVPQIEENRANSRDGYVDPFKT